MVIWRGPFSKDYWSRATDFPQQTLTLKQIIAKYLQKWDKIKKSISFLTYLIAPTKENPGSQMNAHKTTTVLLTKLYKMLAGITQGKVALCLHQEAL